MENSKRKGYKRKKKIVTERESDDVLLLEVLQSPVDDFAFDFIIFDAVWADFDG